MRSIDLMMGRFSEGPMVCCWSTWLPGLGQVGLLSLLENGNQIYDDADSMGAFCKQYRIEVLADRIKKRMKQKE